MNESNVAVEIIATLIVKGNANPVVIDGTSYSVKTQVERIDGYADRTADLSKSGSIKLDQPDPPVFDERGLPKDLYAHYSINSSITEKGSASFFVSDRMWP